MGVIDVVGTATHPDLVGYQVSFAYDPNPTETWFPVLAAAGSQVENGVLGVWDTMAISDGAYMLRLHVFWRDGIHPLEFITRGLVVSNRSATSTPKVTPAIPAPVTREPRHLSTSSQSKPSPPDISLGLSLADLMPNLSGSGYRTAFCRGALWTFVGFVSLALYVNLRKVLRPRVRRFLRRVISDLRRP